MTKTILASRRTMRKRPATQASKRAKASSAASLAVAASGTARPVFALAARSERDGDGQGGAAVRWGWRQRGLRRQSRASLVSGANPSATARSDAKGADPRAIPSVCVHMRVARRIAPVRWSRGYDRLSGGSQRSDYCVTPSRSSASARSSRCPRAAAMIASPSRSRRSSASAPGSPSAKRLRGGSSTGSSGLRPARWPRPTARGARSSPSTTASACSLIGTAG